MEKVSLVLLNTMMLISMGTVIYKIFNYSFICFSWQVSHIYVGFYKPEQDFMGFAILAAFFCLSGVEKMKAIIANDI